MAGKNSAGATAWKVFVGVLVTLLILVFVAEFGLRWFIGKQMTDEFRAQSAAAGVTTTAEPTVTFGASPLILGLLRGEIPHLEMTTPSTLQIQDHQILGQPESTIIMDGMSLSNDPVARDFTATTVIPDDYLLVTFQNAIAEQSGSTGLGNIVVTDITANKAEGVLDFQLGKGLATITLEPSAENGQLELTATNSTLFGIQLPEQATTSITNALREGMNTDFTGGLDIQDVAVGDGTVIMTVHGQNVRFNELSQQMDKLPGGAAGATPGNAPAAS